MIGFNRFEALKKAIKDGKIEFTMMIADFHLIKGTLTQEEYDELYEIAYPPTIENLEETETI